jgi:YesN/AraC family two-component response regulator
MEAAKHYLTSTNDTMEQIADRIGYRSETHFHQVFKQNTGITPRHYRVIKRGEISSGKTKSWSVISQKNNE